MISEKGGEQRKKEGGFGVGQKDRKCVPLIKNTDWMAAPGCQTQTQRRSRRREALFWSRLRSGPFGGRAGPSQGLSQAHPEEGRRGLKERRPREVDAGKGCDLRVGSGTAVTF